ncbi:MAG: copper oxidase [Dehalococcoidia bacterium]
MSADAPGGLGTTQRMKLPVGASPSRSNLVVVLLAILLGAVLLLGGILVGLQLSGTAARPAGPPEASSSDGHDHGIGGTDNHMGPVNVSGKPSAPPFARGNEELTSRSVDGVREFRLTASIVRWSILPTVPIGAYAFNQMTPGPLIRVRPGERIRVVVTNELPEPTSVHWHGVQVPNDQDGAARVTQPPIQPGQTYTYEWTVPETPGSYWYHSHFEPDRQQSLGLYGGLLIEDPTERKPDHDALLILGEWTVTAAGNVPSMPMAGMEPNYFTINGKSWPEVEPIKAKVGQRIRLRFVNAGQFVHPMHLHGQPFTIVATDGNPLPESARWVKDTVLVGPGERYDVEFVARAPGKWLVHCHIAHHTMNDNVEVDGGGGLMMIIEVSA